MPIKQTEADKRNQLIVANHLQKCWHCRMQRQQEFEMCDYAMLHLVAETVTAWVEIKARKMRVNQYSTIYCSLHKWEKTAWRAHVTRLPFYFVVWCMEDNKVIYHTYDSSLRLQVEWTGRTNRGRDDEDVEACVLVPSSRFEPVRRKEQQELL